MSAAVALPVWPAEIAVHPAAELFPLMGGAEFDELVTDVRANGLLDAIVRTLDGRILDGRNRYRACLEAGVAPVFRTYEGEPWRFVISTNLHRRHLTDGQRAMIAAKIAERAPGSNQYEAKVVPAHAGTTPPPTQTEVGKLLNVSVGSLQRARQVHQHGTEALRTAVEAGTVPIATASRVANLPPELQDEFVEQVSAGANPRKVAPPEKAAAVPGASADIPRSSYYRGDRAVLTRAAVANVVQIAGGLRIGLADATALDGAITSEEAARWMGDLSSGIRALRRLHNLLKERSS